MSHRGIENGCDEPSSARRMKGYSLIEILVVLALLSIMTAMSLPYFFNFARMYKSEDQAIKVMDLMREAGQLAITRQRSFRIEIDRNNVDLVVLRMIDENTVAAGTSDDTLVKTIPLNPLNTVRMDVAPAGITPPNPPNYAAAVYTSNVWSIRFLSSGAVVNPTNGLPISATLYSWRPIMEPSTPFDISDLTPARREEVRAVTIYGGSGAVRYWKHTGTTWAASQ